MAAKKKTDAEPKAEEPVAPDADAEPKAGEPVEEVQACPKCNTAMVDYSTGPGTQGRYVKCLACSVVKRSKKSRARAPKK